jgi:hypothetical protein
MRAGQRMTGVVVAAFAAALMIAPGAAIAAKSVYHPKSESRDFAKGDGHWKGSAEYGGTCIQGVTCPEVTNTFEASDGASGAGDGYLRTSIGSLTGVLSTSDGIYTSPAFKYKGVGGAKARTVRFRMSRRSQLTEFLSAAGNSATYSVELLDRTSGSSKTVVKARPLEDTTGWIKTKSVRVKGLKVGHRYKARITSEFVTGVDVVNGGSTDYDNVALIARGAKGGSQASGPDAGDIKHGIKPAKIKGRHLRVRFKCPKSAKPSACDARLSASLSRKGGKVTNNKTIRVRPGKTRVAKLKVKRGLKSNVMKRGKVYVHARVRAKQHVYRVTRKVSVR